MANTLQFDLVSPERRLASLAVTEVQIPGADGDLTAMEGHAPTITTLRPGILRAVAEGTTSDYVVTGGFAEISASSVSVLAERAVPTSEADAAMLDGFIAEARDLADKAVDNQAAADKLVADMIALKVAVTG